MGIHQTRGNSPFWGMMVFSWKTYYESRPSGIIHWMSWHLPTIYLCLKIRNMMKGGFLLIMILSTSVLASVNAQMDTIRINGRNIKVNQLPEGISVYLVYVKMDSAAPKTHVEFWSRTVKKVNYRGTPAFEVLQSWEDKDSIIHTSESVNDAVSFQPLFHRKWWKKKGEQVFDPLDNKLLIDNVNISDTTTSPDKKAIWESFNKAAGTYYLNWNLDLEVLSVLPYRKNVTFLIPFYEYGYEEPKELAYTVTGEDYLPVYHDKKISCWILEHHEKGNDEKFWVSKNTNEVLQLEQIINKKIYRYKVKLPF